MDLPRPLAVKVKKTARKSGPRCLDIPRKQLAGTRQFEANLSDIDDLASLEQAETAIPIPRQTQSHSSSFDYPNGLEHVRGSNPVSTPTDKILLSPSSTVSTFETVKSLSGACSSVVERWSSHSAINTVPFITKTTADSLIDQEQTLVSPRHVADTAYELVPLPFQKEDLGGELAPRNTLEIENVGKLNSPPVLTPIHSSRICSEGKRDTPPVLTPNTASENGIVAKKHLLPTGGVTVVSTADSFLAERELLSCLNADCPSSTPPVERKLFSHLNSDSPASPTQVERNLFSHMSVDSPASPPPSERTSSAQLQYLPPERKLFSHLKDDLSPMPPERKLFSHLKDEVSSLPPERKLFSHLKDDLQTLPVPLSRERKLFAHLNVDSPASPEESDGEEKRSVHSYANNVELKRVRVLRARSPDIPDSPEDNTLNGSSVSVGHAEAKSAAYGSDFQARLCEEDKCRSRLYENETSQHDEAASSSLVISATGARKTQDQGYCDTSVVNTDTGATEEGLKDSTLNQHSDQTAPVSKEILSLELSDPVALASSQESVAPNTSTCSISSVASAPVGSVRSSQVSVSRKETNLSHSRELESASAGILSISTGSRVNSARGPRKNIPSRTPTLSFLNDQVIRGYPSPNIPQGKAKPSMDSELINTSSSSRNLGEHIWYPSPNVYPEVNFEYKLHGSTSGPYYDYSSPHHQYSGIPSHFNMCDAQGNVYGFYTGYDVQGHLTAYPDPAYCHPQVDPAEMFYCDSLGNILQDQRGPSVNSSHWDESSMDKVNDVLLKPPLDRYISSESHKAPNTTPSESVGISSTIRNIVSSVKAVSEKSFGLSCGPKSSSGLVTRAPDDSARKPEPIEKVTNEGIAKSNAVDRQSVLGRSYAQNHDKARHTWPANLSLPRTDKGIKETGLKPQHKRQFIDSQSKCLSQNACDQKHTVGIKHSGSIPSGSDPPNKLNHKGEELLSALENVQNKILNQIDRTAKTMAKASVDQRKKSDSEHGPKQSQYRIPKRSSADAPKHKNIKSGGSKAEKPVISQKLEGKVVEKKLLEELRQKEKKLAEVMQEKAKLLAAKIEMDKEKNSPKLQVGKKSNEEQEKSDAGKSKIAGARMKMPLSFQQLFGNSLNYQGGTDQKAKKPASITSRRSKSTDSTDKGKAVSIGKRRNTADSRENADTTNGGDTKASPIILDESSNTSWKSQGEKKAGPVAERRRSSNSTSSVSSAKSSQSHDSGKSHRSSSGGVADSTHRLKDGDMNSHKTKHRHSSSSHRNHGHGVKVHGHSSKHKSKETVLEHTSRGHIHSKPGRDNEGAGHPLRSDDVLEKVKPRVKPQGETKGKKDEKEPRKVVTVDPSKGPGKGKTLNINKRSEDDFKGSVNSKKLGDQFKGLQSGRPKKDSIPAQIFEHSVEQIKARLKGYEFLPDHGKVGSNYEENVSKFVDEEVSTEVQYAYEVHKTITDCTVRLCKMPTPKTPVNLTPEVIRRCSPCEYSSVLISKLDKKTRLQGVQVEVSRKLMNSKNKTDRLKDGLKLQQVGLSSSSDDDVPLNALLDKLRTPKKVKKIKRKKSGECSMKPTAIDLEKEVKNPTSADGKIFQDELNERRLVSKSDVHVSTAVEPKKANADNSERGRGRPASDKISKKRKNPDSDWTFKENKKRDSDGTGMENRKSYISCENKKFGLDKTSMTCKESQKHDSVGTCKERDSPDYNIACRKPDSDSICEESKKPVPNLTCKESRGKERGNSSNSVLICKEPDPHSTCEESGKPYSDLRYKESERPVSDSTRTEDKKPGSDSSCKKSEQPGPDNTCKESNEPGSDSSGNESKKSDPNSSCLESDKLDGGNFDAGLAVLNKKPETDAERVVLETDQEMFGKDATLDANGNVVCPESCGIAMHNLGEAIEDMGVVIKDTCLDTTDSSELSLGVSCCMEIMQRDDIVKEKGITTGACDEVVPLTPVSNSLADQPAVANMFNRDPGENPSLEVLGTPACEESITRIYEGLLPDDVKLVVPEKELLRDVDEPKATAICTETEVFVGPRSCPAYDRGAASGMKDLIGHMVSEIVRATKENRRKKDTLGDVNESIKAECQTPSVSNDSNDVLNRTSKTLNTTSSEDRTILYGDSSYDFENNSLCGSQGIFSASPEDEDEETHKLLPSRKESDYCQPDSRSESTLSADDFNIQLTPSTNPSSPRDRNSSELLTDKGGTYLPDLRNVSPVHFDGDSMDSFPGSVAVMSPNSFKDACSNIVGSGRKRSVSFALMQAARNSAARKTARFYRTSSPADKTTLVSKLAIPACKLDEQKSSEDAIKLGDAYIHVPSVDSDTDRLDKGGVLECSEYRTASVAVATPVCVEADQRLDVSTLDKAVESFEGGTLKESSDSRGDDTRSELVKISGVDATEDKTFEIGTKWKADEASGDGAGTITKIKITSEEAAIQTKYSAGFSEELVTEPPALGLPEAVDRTQGPDPYSADMQSTASKTAQTQSKDMAIDTSQDKTSSDADIQKNSPTLKIHVRSVKRDMQIMVDIEMVLRSLPAAVVPFLNQLKRYKATQEEVKNLQSLELPKSSSDESRGIDLVYYDDLTRIIDECMEAQNPRGKKDVLKEAEDPKEPTATSMSENTHWFGPETLSPTVQNKPFIKQTEMNAVASNQPGFLKLESSLNKTNQPVNINMPIVLISDKKLQLPPPASFLVISQNYRSSLCPVYTCPTAAVPCVGAELSGRRQSDPARPLVPGIFKLEPQEERLHSSTPSQKKTVKQLLAKTSQKQAVEQPAAGLQIHPAETSRKQSVVQSAAGLQIHQAKTSRKQSVVQPAAQQHLHPAKMSRKQSVEQPITQGKASVCSKSRSDVILKPESRKTDRKKLGASLRERKVPGVQKIGKNYFTDDDVTLFRERLSETLDEVVQDLRNRLSATNASSAQDVFTNSDLSMHQAQNVCNRPTALIGQKRKRRNTHTSCARTRISQMETTDHSQMPNSASYREDHLYQFRGRIEEAMDTASDEVIDSAPKHEELVKIPVSGQSAIENPLRPASSSEEQMPEGNVKLEQGDIRMVPTLGSLASKIMKSAGELSELTVSDTSGFAGPTEESLQTSVLRTVGAGPAKILRRRKSDSDVATQMGVASHCISAPPLDTGDFTVDETDDRASRESVERHFMQAFVPLAGVEEIHRSDEKTVRIKQENEISPKKREQPDIRAARAVQPSSVLRLQDLVKETLITRRISLDAAMFDRVNRERDILFKAVDTSEMSVDDTSGELNTTTSLALDPEDDPKRKKVFNDSVPEFDIGQGLDFSFQTDKVGFIMPSPVDLMPVKDTSGHQHQSGMCATFSSDSTDTEEHFISSHAKGELGSDQILGLEISSDKEQGSIPGKVSSLIDEDKTGASRETDYADVHRTRLNEKDSYGSKEVGPFTSLQLENNEGNEESTKKEKGLSNEFEDNLHVNISTSSECSASSTQSRLFIDTDLDSSISTADKAHFSSESTSPDKAVSETVAQECGDELQEALYSIDGDGLEDTVNGNAEKDILSCACLEVGLCAEDFESCSEEGQTAANMLEGLNILEQGQAAGIADSHKESSQVGAIVLMEDRINEDCPVNVTGFVNSDDSISPVLHIPDTGLQATVEKIKPVLTLQHQPTVVSHEEENPPSSAQPPLLCNRNETTSLSTGLSLVSTMEENSACLTQKLPNSHREEQSALSHHQSLIGKVEDSSLSIQQPPVRDLKEMCLAFRSQGPAVRNGNNISTKDQCPKQVTSVTGIKTFREVTEKEVYQIEKAPSAEEDISLENSPLQQRIDMHGPSNDDMPLDLTKKGVSKRIFVPKAASHSMFYQSAVDLTVKKQEPSNRQWPGLGSLLNHACSSEPRFVSSGTTGHQQAGSQNACKVNRVGPEVIDITDCNPAKKCRTMSQENLTGPSPTDYRPKKVISPQLPLPFSTSYLNSNRQTEMCPEGVNSLPRQPVLNISRAPYGQWMMQSSGEGFLPNPAGGFRGPGGLVRGSFDAVEQRQNTATSSLGLYSNLTDTGPDYISSHLRNQVRPLQNATYQSFENRFLAQNYIDIVNRQFLAIKAQNEKKVAQGPTRHQNMVQNMASDDMLNAMPQGGSSGDMNNPVAAAQPKLSNPSNVPRGHVGSAANETGVDARARLRGVIQARTAGPDLSLRDAPNGVTLASPTVGLNRHTGPTFIPGVNMYPNPSVPSPGSLRSPNFQGVRPELSQMRQRMLHAGPDKQIFPLHPDPMLGMGLNSPFLSNIAGYPHAYPCLYDTRPPSNESMQQRFGSPNLNAAIPGKSPTLQGSGQKKSPAVTPEMVMPTNLTIQAWAAHPRNMHGNHQLSPNQMTPLVRFGNPGVGFPFYTCSPQQSRMLTPPVAQKLSERTPLLGTPTSAIRHHVVAAQNYDLLHQDHTEPVEQGVLAINPSAPALESLPEQRSARLVSQIPGNDQHKRDVSSTTFASHSPSSAAVSNVQSPKPSSGYSYRHPVFPIPSPVKNTPVSASSMMINQSPGKHSAVVAASPVRQHLAQIRPDSTASLTPVGGPEQGVHDELLALKRQLDAERQAREQVQLELEHYKKHHHKGRKKRKHQTGGEEEEEGQRKRHRSQETDG